MQMATRKNPVTHVSILCHGPRSVRIYSMILSSSCAHRRVLLLTGKHAHKMNKDTINNNGVHGKYPKTKMTQED